MKKTRITPFQIAFDQAAELFKVVLELKDTQRRLDNKPKRFVIDTWVDFQPLINGKTLVWYYCDVRDGIFCKVI